MRFKKTLIGFAFFSTMVAIGCDVSDFADTAQLSQPKDEWYSDKRPTQLGFETIDFPGLSRRSEDMDAILFVDCNLHFATIDWSDPILLPSGGTVGVVEIFINEDGQQSLSHYDWYGSSFSRKRVVRENLSISFVGEFVHGLGIVPKTTRGEFLRGLEQDEMLEISQGDNVANWKLEGFKDALGNHCS